MFKAIIFGFFCLFAVVPGDFTYSKVEVTSYIKTQLPDALVRVPNNEILRLYPAARKPIAAFRDATGRADFVVNLLNFTIYDNDYEFLRKIMRAKILGVYPYVEFLSDEHKEINGRKFIVFEFLGSSSQQSQFKHYHHMQYTVLNEGKALSFAFSCPQRLVFNWNEARKKMMFELKIKEPQSGFYNSN